MKLIGKVFLTIYLCISLLGCVSIDGPKFGEVEPFSSNKYSALVIYRISGMEGMMWPHDYYIEGVPVAKLDSGGFTQLFVESGEKIVSSGPKNDKTFIKISVIFEPGQTYYVAEYSGDSVVTPTTLRQMNILDVSETMAEYKYQTPLIVELVGER